MSFPWNGHLQLKQPMSYTHKQNALSETRDMNRVTYVIDDVSMLSRHLRPNVITLKSLIHLRKNGITFGTLLHYLGSFVSFRPSTEQTKRCGKRVVRKP